MTYTFDLIPKTTKGSLKTIRFESKLGNGSEALHSSYYVLGANIHATIAAAKFCIDKKIVKVTSSSIKTNSVPKFVEVSYIDESDGNEEITYYDGLTKMMYALASIGSFDWPIDFSKYGPPICPYLIDYDFDNQSAKLTFDIRAMYRDKNSHDDLEKIILDHFIKYDTNPNSSVN